MDYTMEELLPLVTELSKKYTSFESSSVTYETAQMLMAAVLYCVEECFTCGDTLSSGTRLPARKAYETGYEKVLETVTDAKGVYEQIAAAFQSYGCSNYEATLLNGMPSFFLYYDARFQPQNHILTLDYPVLERCENLQGVNRIYKYLKGIRLEQTFLSYFDAGRICSLLDRVMPDGGKNFMDNICELVLFCAVGCMIADKPVHSLELDAVDSAEIRAYFAEDTIDKAAQKISGIIPMVIKGIMRKDEDGTEAYFLRLSREFAVRFCQPGFVL